MLFFGLYKLAVIQLMIKSLFLQQLFVGTLFDDLSVLHHKDAIGLSDGGTAVRTECRATAIL